MKRYKSPAAMAYGLTLLLITLSGFAQMPVFKRYYIADIPGLGWLAQFYVTHIIHYSAAIVLLAMASYMAFDYFVSRQTIRLTVSGGLRAGIISGLIFSGGLMVVRNLPGVYQAHSFIIAVNLIHLGLCMLLLIVSFFAWKGRKPWVK